jgi:hypothetical protein
VVFSITIIGGRHDGRPSYGTLRDDILLIAAHPSRQRYHQELKWKCIHGWNGSRPVKHLSPRQQERGLPTDGNETDYVRLTYGTVRHTPTMPMS